MSQLSNSVVKTVIQGRERILNAAKTCFFQHGFKTTTMSMVARYAEVSRVTVHKYFSNKEELFIALIENHKKENQDVIESVRQQQLPVWEAIEQLMRHMCKPIFDEISNFIIRDELVYYANKLSSDAVQCHALDFRQAMSSMIKQAVRNNEMQLDSTGLTADDIAKLIDLALMGLAHSSMPTDSREDILKIIQLYRTTTSI